MKKLQNNFTTPEQSKRLLELGVPADSADCYYDIQKHSPFEGIPQVRNDNELRSDFFRDLCFWAGSPIEKIVPSFREPCWSVGRLIEVYDICCYLMPTMELDMYRIDGNETYIEYIIRAFELAEEISDFSKLED